MTVTYILFYILYVFVAYMSKIYMLQKDNRERGIMYSIV